jgi:hypothetical protein
LENFMKRIRWFECGHPLLACLISCGAAGVHSDAAEANTNAMLAEFPFEIRRGQAVLPAQVGGTRKLWLMLDTGFEMTMLNPKSIEELQLARVGKVTIAGIAGTEEAAVHAGPELHFGSQTYTPRRVGVLQSQASRQTRDGILGSGFFRRYVVEMDSKSKQIRLHDPKTFEYTGKGEIIPLKFRRSTPVLDAKVQTPSGELVSGSFELDSGCSGSLCLAKDFVETNKLDPEQSKGGTSERRGIGGDARTRSGFVAKLEIGNRSVEKPDADFFLDGSPADPGMAGHVGFGVLRNFRVFFDYSRSRLILETL